MNLGHQGLFVTIRQSFFWVLGVGLLGRLLVPLSNASEKSSLDHAIATVQRQAAAQGFDASGFSREGLLNWFKSDWGALEFQKQEREKLSRSLALGLLPKLHSFGLRSFQSGDSPTIHQSIHLQIGPIATDGGLSSFQSMQLFSDGRFTSWEEFFLPMILPDPPNMDETLYGGEPLSAAQSGMFPSSVEMRIREVELVWKEHKVPALEVDFLLTPSNLQDLANYFGSAYARIETVQRLQSALGTSGRKWISIREILSGWVGEWLNRFPAEKFEREGSYPNDVCHGVSRQFFSPSLANGGQDRATESTAYLLKNNYHLLADGIDPGFGDYLYLPGQHSIRFILKDTSSGRWIGFSAWSSHSTPYRLWWVDQDYEAPTLRNSPPAADPGFEKQLDVWRRKPDARPIRF
jgi:hypothetical protein